MLEIKDKSLVKTDCLDLLVDWYDGGRRNFIDVIYIDPPFNSQRDYNIIIPGSELSEEAFKDTWSRVGYLDQMEIISKLSPNFYRFLEVLDKSAIPKSYITYLCMMGIRCWYMREMLKDTGSFFYHCDPTASHYIKMMLDTIFGIENFRHELVWESATSSWGKSQEDARAFAYNHQTIFLYTKTNDYTKKKCFVPYYEEKDIKRYKDDDNDGKGSYYWNTLYKWSEEQRIEMEANGEFRWNKGAKFPQYKCYLNAMKGKPITDLITHIKSLDWKEKENLHYPTQKPERLLELLINVSSEPGDLIVDFYLGGGTTIVTAEKLGRRYIGTDINFRALQIAEERLESLKLQVKKDFFMYGIGSSKDIREMIDRNLVGERKDSRFWLEDLLFKYCFKNPKVVGNEKKVSDDSIDGRFMFDFNGKKLLGIAQATVSGNKAHLRGSASHFFSERENAKMLVYITWKDKINDKLIEEAKSYGKISDIDKVTLMTLEEVIDEGKQIKLPSDTRLAGNVPIQPNQLF